MGNSFLQRLLTPKAPPLLDLWRAIVFEARREPWYLRHAVADDLDGRFDIVALVTSLVILRMEGEGMRKEPVLLIERFVDDMEGSLREMGVGDQVVGKQVGNMVGALGGRLGAYRDAFASADPIGELTPALERNVYRGADVHGAAPGMAEAVRALHDRIAAMPMDALLEGRLQ